MSWWKRDKPSLTTPVEEDRTVKTEGLWVKCDGCRQPIFRNELDKNLQVCPKCGFHFRISALERLDPHLLEAAADLGCAPWEVFVRVTLPLSMPGVAAAFFFVFIPTLGEWVTPALVGGANGIMFGNVIQDQFVRALNWPLGSLMSLVMLAVSLVLTILFSRIGRLTDLAGV